MSVVMCVLFRSERLQLWPRSWRRKRTVLPTSISWSPEWLWSESKSGSWLHRGSLLVIYQNWPITSRTILLPRKYLWKHCGFPDPGYRIYLVIRIASRTSLPLRLLYQY